MFVELHMLQNFAFSNLNRDLSGAPKDCEFGGYRRARISSQCIKRSIRDHFRSAELLPAARLGERTKRLLEDLIGRLVASGKDPAQAQAVAEAALRGMKLKTESDGKTQYLLFLGRAEIEALAAACLDNWDSLTAGSLAPAAESSGRRQSARDAKREAQQSVPAAVQKVLLKLLDGGRAADLALFGRMIADLPDKNTDAACQMAHAFSTNRARVEFDFYTALDDLKKDDVPGADMMGTIEFNSACYYRYSNVDLEQLKANLDGDEELARQTLSAFLQASIEAVPTGKQNSSAAQNPPSFILAVLRDRGLWSLANAFARPVYPSGDQDLVQASVAALDSYWGELAGMYGEASIKGKWVATTNGCTPCLSQLGEARVAGARELIQSVAGAVAFKGGQQ